MTTEDSSEAMPEEVPPCKGALCHEEMERVMPINADPMSCAFDTGWDKRGRKAGHMVNAISNDSGVRDDVLNVINRWNGSIANKIRAKELMDSIKFEGVWCEWEDHQKNIWIIFGHWT